MSETDTSRRSLDHGWKAWCIDLGRKILGHHWLADTSFLLASLSLRGPGFIFRRGLIDRRQLCASLGGIVPPCGVRVGQTKALGKVEPMMGINGWEMSTNTALCHTEGHFSRYILFYANLVVRLPFSVFCTLQAWDSWWEENKQLWHFQPM